MRRPSFPLLRSPLHSRLVSVLDLYPFRSSSRPQPSLPTFNHSSTLVRSASVIYTPPIINFSAIGYFSAVYFSAVVHFPPVATSPVRLLSPLSTFPSLQLSHHHQLFRHQLVRHRQLSSTLDASPAKPNYLTGMMSFRLYALNLHTRVQSVATNNCYLGMTWLD
ncbi:hypothetical protein BS47DRAFT_1402220 [Hydnum rufescens UP504]|uniref:Uncharacterized protein n=1 Tax=Hydnum rufescens UP504 TaxID=1448309 RepID=A0A9P6DMK2_9AGAM|nr:hypothetical protein BS47DRAFT_1402220 [Hydnum rufescens UP504]